MKKQSAFLMSVLSTVWIITFTGCKKDSEVPSLVTSQVTMISATEGTTGGNVWSTGGSGVTGPELRRPPGITRGLACIQ